MKTAIFALVFGLCVAVLMSGATISGECQNYTSIVGHGNNHLLINNTNLSSVSWCPASADKICLDDYFCYNGTVKIATDIDESVALNNGTDYGSMCEQKIGWYHFKDFGAVNVDDKCGLYYGAINGVHIGYENGFVGTGLKLPGINTEYVLFNNLGGEHKEFSITFWASPKKVYDINTSGLGARLFRWEDAGTDWFFCGTAEGSCSTNGGFLATLNSTILTSTTKNFSPTKWYFFAITYSFSTAGNFSKLYINGTLEDTKTVYHAYDMDNLKLGARPGGWSAYNGTIDELIFWNYTLSGTEILNLYNYSFEYGTTHYSIPVIPLNVSLYDAETSYCLDQSYYYQRLAVPAENGTLTMNNKTTMCAYGCQNFTLTSLGSPGCAESPLVFYLMLIAVTIMVTLLIVWLGRRST